MSGRDPVLDMGRDPPGVGAKSCAQFCGMGGSLRPDSSTLRRGRPGELAVEGATDRDDSSATAAQTSGSKSPARWFLGGRRGETPFLAARRGNTAFMVLNTSVTQTNQ